jgi:uncharacterized protein (TIGR03437 family)
MSRSALIVLVALFATVAHGDDWPMYLGDLSHTSFRSGETQINTLNASGLQPLWKLSLGAPIASAVTVSNGSLFFGDWAGNFHSVNATTGSAAWSQFLGVAPSPTEAGCMAGIGVNAQPVIAGQSVYAGGGDSAIYAMDRNNGTIQWRVPLADPASGAFLWSSLVLYQNALYIGIASLTDCPLVRGGLARIPLDDPTHPQIVYFTPADSVGAGVWSTPAIDSVNNLIYVTTGNSTDNVQDAGHGIYGSALLSLDATTLQIQSSFFMPLLPDENDNDWGSSPLLFQSGTQPLVAANGKNGMMYVLHRPDLALVWSYKLARDCDSPTLGCGSVSTPAFDGNTLVTGAGQPDGDSPAGTVYGFDPVSQHLLWRYGASSAVLAPVTLTPGLVFVSTSSGLAVLDSASGSELWNDGGSTGLYSQPVVSNGVVYSTYINGDVVAWSPGAGNGGLPTVNVSPAGLIFSYTLGGPSPATQPVAVSASTSSLNFTVSSDSPWLTTSLSSGTTPIGVNVQVASPSAVPGDYSGNLTFTSTSGAAVSLPVIVVVNPAPPPLTSTNVLNAASFQPGLSPGSLFTVFGDFSADTTTTTATPWPLSWNGISINIGGIAAPLEYVSPKQINAQVPFTVAPGTVPITLLSNGVSSGPISVTIQAASPGIFTDSGNHAMALNQDSTPNQAANPAAVGSYISVYLTGQGMVDAPVSAGMPAPSNSISHTLASTTATIDGTIAPVSFSGLAPGYAGLTQVNLQVPNLQAGNHLLVVTIGGWQSNAALITTKQ